MNRTTLLTFSAVLVIASVGLAGCFGGNQGCTPKALADVNTLIVGMDATFPPMEQYHETNGTFTGFDVDLMREIAAVMGKNVEFRNVGWDALPPSLDSCQIDVIASSMTITAEREQDRDFTQPYYLVNQSVMVRSDSTITNVSQLNGLRIGVQEGTTGDLWATENLTQSQDKIQRFATYPEAANALASASPTVDAVIMDRPPQVQFAGNNSAVKVAFDIPTTEPLGLAVKQGRLDLLNALNSALAELENNGKLAELKNKYNL